MKGTIVYQICCEGQRKSFSGLGKIQSKNVYLEKPTQEQIDVFVEKCCNSEHPNNLYDLEKEGIKIKILELIIS